MLLITTSDSEYQQQLSDTIKNRLEATDLKPVAINAAKVNDDNISSMDLVIAIGKDTVTLISKDTFRSAILNVLTDSANKDKSISTRSNQAKVHMTQPMCRQLRLIKSLQPEWKTVGLLMSEQNQTKASTLARCGRKYKLDIKTVTVAGEEDLIPALNNALSNSDVLLSIPDPAIYNSRTIKNILLTSYRHRVPIIGFSESFAEAGAIAAVHTSAEQLGNQVTDIVLDYFKHGRTFSRMEFYPSDFSVTTNQQVARSLEIFLDDREMIEAQLRKLESGND